MRRETPRLPGMLAHTRFPLVSVALATYNGTPHLPEFLASLEAQTWPNLEVVVSDDGSTDGTPDLLQSYRGPLRIRVVAAGERVGIARNFERAMAGCEGEFITLADQDDVWAPEKIADAVAALQAVAARRGADTPALAFCDIELVDARLACLSRSLFHITTKSANAARLRDFLLSNHIPGCSMLLNRAAVERALPMPPQVVMHDWWLAMVAAAFGEIVHVAKPHLKYRQHGGNAVGAAATGSCQAVRDPALAALSSAERRERGRRRQINGVAAQLQAFAFRFGDELPPRAQADMAALSRGLANMAGALWFVTNTHTGETFLRSLKMLRRLRLSVLRFGMDAGRRRGGRTAAGLSRV